MRDSWIWENRKITFGSATVAILAASIVLIPSTAVCLVLGGIVFAVPAAIWLFQTPFRWLTLFLLAALLLPPLPLSWGDSGPHIAILFAAAGFWFGIVHFKAFSIRMDAVGLSLLALLAVMLSSAGMAMFYSGPQIAFGSIARACLFGISVYVYFFCQSFAERPAQNLIAALFIAASISALLACLDFYFHLPPISGFGAQYIWLENGVFRRAQGVFYEASTLGGLCACFLQMIAVSLLFLKHQSLRTPILLAGGSVLATALVLSYSRASLVSLVTGLLVLVILHRRKIRVVRVLLGTLLVSVSAFVFLAHSLSIFGEAYWLRLLASYQYFLDAPNLVLSGRIGHWSVLLDFIADHPWHALLGIGYKTLPYSHFIGNTAIADNTYLGALLEMGLPGLAAVIALNVAMLRTSWKLARSQNAFPAFCGTWIFCFWSGQCVQMLSADLLTYWRVLPVDFCVLALGLSYERSQVGNHSVSRSV